MRIIFREINIDKNPFLVQIRCVNPTTMSTEKSNDDDGEPAYSSFATLDEPPFGLTCSRQAVSSFAPGAEVSPASSFEEAREITMSGRAAAFVVPAAYPKIGNFLQDDALRVVAVFLFRIPALVLASAGKVLNGPAARVFHHPATAPLVPKANLQVGELTAVSSNTAAAARAHETGGTCITNAACAAHFGLRVLQILRPSMPMPFVVFAAA